MLSNKQILITNNPLVNDHYSSTEHVEFLDTDLSGVLTHVRNYIHKGHRLLTHPMSGSIKPNESPYKSILISDEYSITDMESVNLIEEAILATGKFPEKDIPEKNLKDMQIVDLSIILECLNNK